MQITNFIKGGNLLTLMVISLFLLLSVNPVNAIVYESLVSDPVGIGSFSSTEILITESHATAGKILILDLEGAGSTQSRITDLSYPEDATVGGGGLIYFILRDGKVYKCLETYGISSFDSDYNTSFQLLADVGGTFAGESRSIVIDASDNIYISVDTSVYKLSYPSYSSSVYTTVPNEMSGTSVPNEITSLAIHPDGLIISTRAYTSESPPNYARIYLYNGTNNIIYTKALGLNYAYAEFDTVFAVDNGDVYYSYTETNLYRLNYSDSWSTSSIATVAAIDDIFINYDGIIYTSHISDDTVKTYATVDLSGGYTYEYYEGATGAKQLIYDTSTVNSLYAAYNNDSIIEIAYNVDIDVSETDYHDLISFGTYFGASDLLDDFYWEIDLLNPSGIKIEDISISNAVIEDYGAFDFHVRATGTKQLQSDVWDNGTWTLNLYENDRTIGLRALLDTDTFLITDEITSTTVTDVTPDVDQTLNPTNRINALLASNTFIGVLILLSFIGAFGKIGGVTGLVLGTVAGVSMSALLGYVPMWFVFIMALALAVVFTSKLVGGLGGDK